MSISTSSLLFAALCVLAVTVPTIDAGSAIIGNIQIQWMNRGSHTDFRVMSPLGRGVDPKQCWLAIAFNSKPHMPGSNAVVCKLFDGKSAVQSYYNSGYTSSQLDNKRPSIGISDGVVQSNGREIMCSFSRDNLNSHANYFNIRPDSKPYLLAAFGKVSSTGTEGTIQHHMFRGITPMPVTFEIGTARTPARHAKVDKMYHKYINGSFMVGWKNAHANYTNFIIRTNMTDIDAKTNVYTAFAISKDRQVGNDDISVCIYSKDFKGVQHFYSQNHSAFPLDETNMDIGLSHAKVSFKNGTLTCKFRRVNKMPSVEHYFNTMHRSYYILTASGVTNENGTMLEHFSTAASIRRIHLNHHHNRGQLSHRKNRHQI